MLIEIIRDDEFPTRTFGKMFIDGRYFCEVLEDTDRYIEGDGVKVPKETAIPRGRYRVVVSMSNRFKRLMPEVLDVPHFTGIRMHGGNTEFDTEGCPLLGAVRLRDKVANCKGVNDRLLLTLQEAARRDEDVWLEVR